MNEKTAYAVLLTNGLSLTMETTMNLIEEMEDTKSPIIILGDEMIINKSSIAVVQILSTDDLTRVKMNASRNTIGGSKIIVPGV